MLRLRILAFFMSLIFAGRAASEPVLKIRVLAPVSMHDMRRYYEYEVLRLILKKTESEYGPAEVVPSAKMNQIRAFRALQDGELLDVVANTSDFKNEKNIIPIRHGILKGIKGIRLFLIKKERQAEFSKIRTLAELKKYTAGHGAEWPDTKILQYNGFQVETGFGYDGLFSMLEAGRFDFFPRAVSEIYQEFEAHKHHGIVVEESLALVYSLPVYFYVNKHNKALAERLEKGWDIALRDGSFDKLFDKAQSENLKRAGLSKRRIFMLSSPYSEENVEYLMRM